MFLTKKDEDIHLAFSFFSFQTSLIERCDGVCGLISLGNADSRQNGACSLVCLVMGDLDLCSNVYPIVAFVVVASAPFAYKGTVLYIVCTADHNMSADEHSAASERLVLGNDSLEGYCFSVVGCHILA